jgi:hypothetical protein
LIENAGRSVPADAVICECCILEVKASVERIANVSMRPGAPALTLTNVYGFLDSTEEPHAGSSSEVNSESDMSDVMGSIDQGSAGLEIGSDSGTERVSTRLKYKSGGSCPERGRSC